MRRRYRILLLNVFSLALLTFSLYLNYVKKDAPELPAASGSVQPAQTASVSNETQKTVVAKEHHQASVVAK